MKQRRSCTILMMAVGALCVPALMTACQASAGGQRIMARPVSGWYGVNNVSRAGEFTFAGQPTEEALDRYASEGGAMVIDLRMHRGPDEAAFDEQARVETLGMKYVHIPVMPDTFSTMDVKRFVEATREAGGPVLVHCASSNRVGGMWAAYLALEKGVPTEKAIKAGKAAGLSSDGMEEATRRVIGR